MVFSEHARAHERFADSNPIADASQFWAEIPDHLWGRVVRYLAYPAGSTPKKADYCLWVGNRTTDTPKLCRIGTTGNMVICNSSEIGYE